MIKLSDAKIFLMYTKKKIDADGEVRQNSKYFRCNQ